MFGTMKVIVIYNKVFFIYKSTNRIAPIIMYMSDKPTNLLGLNWVTRKVYYLSVAWFKYDSVGIFSSLILKWNFFSNTFSFSWPKKVFFFGLGQDLVRSSPRFWSDYGPWIPSCVLVYMVILIKNYGD